MKAMTFFSVSASAAALLAAAPVYAATTISGSVTNVNVLSSDPGLVLYGSPVAFADIVLNSVGDMATRVVANIGTNETALNLGDDYDPYPLSLTFGFTNPAGTTGSPLTGTSRGQFFPSGGRCDEFYVGCLRFDGPVVFDFGVGGQFSVQLRDEDFAIPGNTNVTAKFTLLSESRTPAVPEPATWAMMLLGFGLIGGAMRSRKRQQPRVRFAF
ncbi:MAG: PEPxxWA-CTERM sorting domain-containing protein [Novosphingobium sp.]